MFALIDIPVFAAGFAAAWYGKDSLQKWWQGAEAFAVNLKAEAAGIEAKAAAIKSAVTTAAKS